MDKTILAAASCANQKYFLNPQFSALPDSIKEEVQIICVLTAQRLLCAFVMGFFPSGDLYFETVKEGDAIDFDDIGAELEIKALQKEKKELLKSLKLWYLLYQTAEGEEITQKFRQEKE